MIIDNRDRSDLFYVDVVLRRFQIQNITTVVVSVRHDTKRFLISSSL